MSNPRIGPVKTVNYTPSPSMQDRVKDLESRVSTLESEIAKLTEILDSLQSTDGK